MKKLVAILFLSLISLNTFSGVIHLWEKGYEVLADGEEKDAERKEGKKEAKEFTLQNLKKLYAASSVNYTYDAHQAFAPPQPVLDKHTPPPDPAF